MSVMYGFFLSDFFPPVAVRCIILFWVQLFGTAVHADGNTPYFKALCLTFVVNLVSLAFAPLSCVALPVELAPGIAF